MPSHPRQKLSISPKLVGIFLGKIYEEEGDLGQAADKFEIAVELDPHYFNAWLEIAKLPPSAAVSEGKVQEAALAVCRLDPMDVHGGFLARTAVLDYGKLWSIYLEAYKSLPPAPKRPLFRLKTGSLSQEGNYRENDQTPDSLAIFHGPGATFSEMPDVQSIWALSARNDP